MFSVFWCCKAVRIFLYTPPIAAFPEVAVVSGEAAEYLPAINRQNAFRRITIGVISCQTTDQPPLPSPLQVRSKLYEGAVDGPTSGRKKAAAVLFLML
jgi:hypothetical protein